MDLGDSGLIPDRDCNVAPPHIYTDCSEKSQVPRGHFANLHYKEFKQTQLNGGNASTIYNSKGQLDLGNAGYIADRDCNIDPRHIDTDCSEKSQVPRGHFANLHYKEFKQTQINGGNAYTTYSLADEMDLGDSRPPIHIHGENYILSNQPCNILDENKSICVSNITLYTDDCSANLHYSNFTQSNLNGGNAYTIYNSTEHLDLGNSTHLTN